MEIRRLGLDEMDAAAEVHRAAFDERLPWLTGLHTPEEDRAYFRDRVFPACEVWGAMDLNRVVAIIAFREEWIDQLYVLPAFQGRGAGAALLNLAKAVGAPLRLWTFQKNAPARAFYERRGFVAEAFTDGAGNEEREPDVLYAWSGPGG